VVNLSKIKTASRIAYDVIGRPAHRRVDQDLRYRKALVVRQHSRACRSVSCGGEYSRFAIWRLSAAIWLMAINSRIHAGTIALDARLTLLSPAQTRQIKLSEFLRGSYGNGAKNPMSWCLRSWCRPRIHSRDLHQLYSLALPRKALRGDRGDGAC